MSKQSDIVKVSQGAAGDPLFVDSTNNRVGVGTTLPDELLELSANTGAAIKITSTDVNLVAGETIGSIKFESNDSSGTPPHTSAQIDVIAEDDFGRGAMVFSTGRTGDFQEGFRLDSSGNLLVGKTTTDNNTVGAELNANGSVVACSDNVNPAMFNRKSSDGDIALFRKDGTTVGSIGNIAGRFAIYGASNVGIAFDGNQLIPTNGSGSLADNVKDLGNISYRFDDVYATNGTIQTSDANEKQQIAELTVAEITAAKAISKLFKTFKWNSSVEEKGEAARIHSGVIAQDVEQAMTDAGLDAGRYAFFIGSTWWELDGQTYETAEEAPEGAVERTRKGIRYPQLLSFVGAATEQRLASIESRLDALEGN
jgi:hypothetical protein